MDKEELREALEELYEKYNRREYVSPDPLEFLYLYDDAADVETVGLIASSLAYGKVASILASVRRVLDVLGPHPSRAAVEMPLADLDRALEGFCHRFVKGPEMARFIHGIGRAVEELGSLEALFKSGFVTSVPRRADVIGAMDHFAAGLLERSGLGASHLLPRASKGSACKRLALYVRWMVRRDDVDLGCWHDIPKDAIIIPLDTHMFNITTRLGFIKRSSADGRSAIEATDAFAAIAPDDPTRYDFALTRFGIRGEMSVDELFIRSFHGGAVQ